MSNKSLSILMVLIVLALLAACAGPTPAPTQPPAPAPTNAPAATSAPAPTTAPAATSAPAPAGGDVANFQADTTNLFPNGIGAAQCQGVKLTIATQTGPQIASPMENHWKEWGAKTGGTVEVQTFPFGDLFEKIRAGFVSGASPFDVIVYASDWAGDLMGAGYLLEVPQKYQDMMGYKYLIPTYRDRILTWGGKVYGTPYDGDAHNTYLRKDLLTDPKNMADFKAKYGYDIVIPIKTWTQYHDIAEFFNGKTINGTTLYGAGTAFKRKAQSYWTYLGIAAPFAKSPNDPAYFFDPDTMQPRINNPGFVKALDFYSSLVKVGPPDVVNWDVGDIRNNFPAGKLALAIDWGDVGPLSADPKSSVVTAGWSAQAHPGVDQYYDSKTKAWVTQYNQAPFLAFGGWIGGVSKTTKNVDCAFDFMSFMGNYNMSLLNNVTPGTGVNPHFYSDLNNLAPWVKSGMSEAQAKEYLQGIKDTISSPNAVVDLRITGAAEYFDALDTQLARAVAGEVTSQAALDEVAKEWNAITDRLGRDQQTKLFKQMLGLPTEGAAAAPTSAPAAPTAAPSAGADVANFQADTTNLFPNGIGAAQCQGVKLTIATQTGPQIASPMENHWKEWGAKTGGTVEVQTFPFGDLFEKIRAGFVSGASPFDVIVYASDWAGDLMGAGYLLEVPQKYQDMMGYKYLIPTYRDRILTWGGKVYGTPYDGDAHNTYLRKDLLTDPKNMADFKAKYGYDIVIPIKTWTQYHDIAEFFNGKTINGTTLYGAGTAFKRKAQSYWTYLGIAAPFAKSPNDPAYFFDPDTMQPRINNPGFVKALDFYSSLVKVGPPDVVNWDVGDIRNNFPAGKLALAIDWGDVGPLSADPKSSVVTAGWSAQAHPGVDQYYDSKTKAWVTQYNQAPFLAFGGWIGGVSKTTKNVDCAFDFMSFMGNYNMSLLNNVTPGTGVNPHFYSDLNNLAPWVKSGMSEAQAKEYLQGIKDTISSPNAVVDLRITGAAEYFDALDTQLARAVAGEVTSQAALDEVAKEWNAITDRLGRDQQTKLFKQMLGLPTQ